MNHFHFQYPYIMVLKRFKFISAKSKFRPHPPSRPILRVFGLYLTNHRSICRSDISIEFFTKNYPDIYKKLFYMSKCILSYCPKDDQKQAIFGLCFFSVSSPFQLFSTFPLFHFSSIRYKPWKVYFSSTLNSTNSPPTRIQLFQPEFIILPPTRIQLFPTWIQTLFQILNSDFDLTWIRILNDVEWREMTQGDVTAYKKKLRWQKWPTRGRQRK